MKQKTTRRIKWRFKADIFQVQYKNFENKFEYEVFKWWTKEENKDRAISFTNSSHWTIKWII